MGFFVCFKESARKQEDEPIRLRWRKSREKDMETERLQKETQSILRAQKNNTEEYDVIELKISDT